MASPSDLGDERHVAREAVNEINRTVARPSGFHVDLIGWEDTLSSAGRPQAVINDDLATCQMFIGMLWARWGTPPDTTGRHTSGFEEEFQLACERNERVGDPHITLFFKDVQQSKLSDPGPELSKVLNFKRRIIEEKKVLFETFVDAGAFAQKVRVSVSDFIHKLDRNVRSARSEASSEERPTESTPPNAPGPGEERPSRSHAVEAAFLVGLSQKITGGNGEEPSEIDIARLRNVAAAHRRGGNDELTLGPHDANVVYQGRIELDLSPREFSALADAGLDAWSQENTPLWSWLANRLKEFPAWLFYSTVVGPDRRRIGAFRAMTVMKSLIVEDDFLKIESLGELWFGPSVADAVKNAALDYIGMVGATEYAVLAEDELGRNNYATRGAALEAIIRVRGRESVKAAARYAIDASFDVLSDAPMALILSGLGELKGEELRAALDHRSGAIRAKTIEVLSTRKKLDDVQIRRFFGDPSIEARRAAVTAYESNVRQLSDDEAKDALVLKEIKGGLGGNSNYDLEGDAAFYEFKRRHLKERLPSELAEGAKSDPLNTEDFYFATADAHFARAAEQLRFNVDDRFAEFWQEYLDEMRGKYGDATADLFKNQQGFRRRTMMRQALDILVKRGMREDLSRLRKVLDDDAVDPRFVDISYLVRWGNWEDIPRVAKIGGDYRATYGSNRLLTRRIDLKLPALGILKLAGNRIAEIPSLDISPDLLAKAVSGMPMAAFRKLGRPVIETLLSREADAVRKATALQVLCSFSAREARAYLTRYLGLTKHRYYNVIFWLDLCQAWDWGTYCPIARQELQST